MLSGITDSMRKARRRVRPVLANAMPISSEPTMNHTEGSMKSVNAVRESRISHTDWTMPITMAVMPTGMTSNTHHRLASRNRPRAAWPSRPSTTARPSGAVLSGRPGTATERTNSSAPTMKGR